MPTSESRNTQPIAPATQGPEASRKLVVGVVTLAVLLSALGMLLATQQSTLLIKGRVADLHPEAYRRIASVHQAVSTQIERTFADLALRGCGDELDESPPIAPDVDLPPAPPVTWLRAVFLWDQQNLRLCTVRGVPIPTAPEEETEQLETVLRPRLEMALIDARAGQPPGPQPFLYSPAGVDPKVVVYAPIRQARGTLVVGVAMIDLEYARRDLVDPQIGVDGDLAVEDTGSLSFTSQAHSEVWSESMGPVFPFWSVRPSDAFVQAQEAFGRRQTLLYASVTLLGLVALLLAIRAMNRVVQHEISLSRMKANFVADVSHELKTPLALIRMFAETLLSGRITSEEKAREYYDIITRESTRLTHLIDNILDFSRIDAGRKHYRREPIDVGHVVRKTYDAYRHELDHHGFEHHCTIADKLPQIHGDDDAIGQVVLNLISNAIKYSADEKHLHVDVLPETRRDRHGVLICVRDRGIGIRPEDRAHLFDGFFRAPDERVRRSRGTGLGLALCKKIVDAHGGYIDVESRLVKGSEFRVFLPEDHDSPEDKD